MFVQGEPDYNRTDKSSGGIEMTGPAAPKDPEKARPFFYILKDKDTFYTFIVFKILQKLNFKFAYHANP